MGCVTQIEIVATCGMCSYNSSPIENRVAIASLLAEQLKVLGNTVTPKYDNAQEIITHAWTKCRIMPWFHPQ
jgi:hypothetical protein